jgi:hypothetical protein
MTLVHACGKPGCATLTMGTLCLEHEEAAEGRLRSRIGRLARGRQAPAITIVLAVAAALAGRIAGRLGQV